MKDMYRNQIEAAGTGFESCIFGSSVFIVGKRGTNAVFIHREFNSSVVIRFHLEGNYIPKHLSKLAFIVIQRQVGNI